MQLKELMTRNVRVVHPNGALAQAARQVREWSTGLLSVCDGRRVVSVLTDQDIAVRAVAPGRGLKTTRVRDVMTSDVISCSEDQDTREAVALMEARQIRRLMILDRHQELVGIVSLEDLAAEPAALSYFVPAQREPGPGVS
jgi:CBS domain-containing protein